MIVAFAKSPTREQSVLVRNYYTDADGSRFRINIRVNEGDPAGKRAARQRLDLGADFLSVSDGRRVFGKETEHQPHGRKVCQLVDRLSFLDILPLNRQLLDHGTADRSTQVHAAVGFAGLFQVLDLHLRHAEQN